jgi:cyclic pyranopterin phosphate synthase
MTYMRVSITDRCNLRCMYCRPNGLFSAIPHREILSYEELYRIIGVAVGLGIEKIRITGGEPLVRRGAVEFMAELSRMKGLNDLALTTNGVFLKENLAGLVRSGLKRINISLDTLRPDRFRSVTGLDRFRDVWDGILLAEAMKIEPIKINMVVMRGVNHDEIVDMAKLSLSHGFHIRFIEYMPIGTGKQVDKSGMTVSVGEMKTRLSTIGSLEPVAGNCLDGPAKRFRFYGAKGEVGLISAMSDHFCHSCNRLRLTPSGALKPCLLSDRKEDIKNPVRRGVSDKELENIFVKAVNRKPRMHLSPADEGEWVTDLMSAIGG